MVINSKREKTGIREKFYFLISLKWCDYKYIYTSILHSSPYTISIYILSPSTFTFPFTLSFCKKGMLVGWNENGRNGMEHFSFVCWHMRMEMEYKKWFCFSHFHSLKKLKKGENETFKRGLIRRGMRDAIRRNKQDMRYKSKGHVHSTCHNKL